ncbi:glutathione S-transferase [Halobacteriovorax sp. HLS]|uniref:glutathione S-transferase n=1 Tax=Halobacteriovorax sp. HLS TaxID=2234000 RepID=UPI000FDBE55B|nr:glutathione S-transferase [Halobacteriovorax sp. HLS]
MITVHHLNNSRSQRILWLLEELGLAYEIKKYERDPITYLAPEELKQVHPLGKSPVITVDDIVIAESGAIIEFLIREYGKDGFKESSDKKLKQKLSYWLHFAEGSLMPPFVMKLVFDKIKNSPMPFFVKPVARMIANKVMTSFVGPNIKGNLDFIEAHLKKNDWFLGNEISAADIQMSFPLEAGMGRIENKNDYPSILKFVHKIQKRAAYIRALDKGGRYDYAQK